MPLRTLAKRMYIHYAQTTNDSKVFCEEQLLKRKAMRSLDILPKDLVEKVSVQRSTRIRSVAYSERVDTTEYDVGSFA